MIKIHEAILYLYPHSEFSLLEDNYETLQWYSTEYQKPTLEEIEQAKLELSKQKLIDKNKADYNIKINVIKDKLFEAIMLDDKEEQIKLKLEYAKLKAEVENGR